MSLRSYLKSIKKEEGRVKSNMDLPLISNPDSMKLVSKLQRHSKRKTTMTIPIQNTDLMYTNSLRGKSFNQKSKTDLPLNKTEQNKVSKKKMKSDVSIKGVTERKLKHINTIELSEPTKKVLRKTATEDSKNRVKKLNIKQNKEIVDFYADKKINKDTIKDPKAKTEGSDSKAKLVSRGDVKNDNNIHNPLIKTAKVQKPADVIKVKANAEKKVNQTTSGNKRTSLLHADRNEPRPSKTHTQASKEKKTSKKHEPVNMLHPFDIENFDDSPLILNKGPGSFSDGIVTNRVFDNELLIEESSQRIFGGDEPAHMLNPKMNRRSVMERASLNEGEVIDVAIVSRRNSMASHKSTKSKDLTNTANSKTKPSKMMIEENILDPEEDFYSIPSPTFSQRNNREVNNDNGFAINLENIQNNYRIGDERDGIHRNVFDNDSQHDSSPSDMFVQKQNQSTIKSYAEDTNWYNSTKENNNIFNPVEHLGEFQKPHMQNSVFNQRNGVNQDLSVSNTPQDDDLLGNSIGPSINNGSVAYNVTINKHHLNNDIMTNHDPIITPPKATLGIRDSVYKDLDVISNISNYFENLANDDITQLSAQQVTEQKSQSSVIDKTFRGIGGYDADRKNTGHNNASTKVSGFANFKR